MSVLVVCGAGASYGSGECEPHPPPLGDYLFTAMRDDGWIPEEIDRQYADAFSEDFEAGMVRLWEEEAALVAPLLQKMSSFFAGFIPGEGNRYVQVIRAAQESTRHVVFATTNYDMLLEISAIHHCDMGVVHNPRPDSPDELPVLELHGSSHILPDIDAGQIRGIGFDMSASSIDETGAILGGAGVRTAGSIAEIEEFCRTSAVPPVVSMYARGKRVLACPEFIDAQHEMWDEEASRAQDIFIIGLRYGEEDTHIWDTISRADGQFYYVGGEESQEEFRTWRDDQGIPAARARSVAETFEEAMPRIRQVLGR